MASHQALNEQPNFACNKSRSRGTSRHDQPPPAQVSPLLNSVPVSSRVYILGLEDAKRITVKEVTYVDPSKAGAAPGRPFWVPAFVAQGNWSASPPCFWKVDSLAMQDLETGGSNLMYNPMSDYSLELIRWYRPDLFDSLFQLFCVWSKWIYNERQLAQLKELIRPELLMVDDIEGNFGTDSPLATTLKKASLTEDFLPEIEHYLALLTVRAFKLRSVIMHIH